MTQSRKKKSNERNSLGALCDKRDRALERPVAIFEKYRANGGPPPRRRRSARKTS